MKEIKDNISEEDLKNNPSLKDHVSSNDEIGIPVINAPETVSDFGDKREIIITDEKGRQTKHLLLSNNQIAVVREGKGSDVERASLEANGDQSKYLSSMIASCLTLNGKQINMFDLAELPMKDYMKIQIAFSEINF